MERLAIPHFYDVTFKKAFLLLHNINLREVGAAALMRVLSNTAQWTTGLLAQAGTAWTREA